MSEGDGGMRVAVVVLTRSGAEIAYRLGTGMGDGVDIFFHARLRVPGWPEVFEPTEQNDSERIETGIRKVDFTGTLTELVGELFARYRRIVFVMAVGVVVRVVAPHLRDKRRDPAVVVSDEKGRYVISLLSGHLGGANDLARAVARVTGGCPVITTATDVQGRPAIDLLARDMGWEIEPLEGLRKVNAAILDGARVAIYSEVDPSLLRERLAALASGEDALAGIVIRPLEEYRPDLPPDGREGEGPRQLAASPSGEPPPQAMVFVTNRRFSVTDGISGLFLRPRNLIAGIGCRRGIPGEAITEAIALALDRAGLATASLKALATVDLKEDEAAIRAAATQLGLPLIIVSRDEIKRMEQSGAVKTSPFVTEKIGVGAVCEPVALLAGNKTKLLLPKTTFPTIRGVTVAIALETSVERSGWLG